MEYDKSFIDKYKESVLNEFLVIPIEKIKQDFETDRICWAFVIWTYRWLGLIVEDELQLKTLIGKFKKVEYEQHYNFPDIVLFKGDISFNAQRGGIVGLTRHAGVMLDKRNFVHIGVECNGVQFTHLDRNPWNRLKYIVIRYYEANNNL